MRDLALVAIVVGMIPMVLKRPFWGLLLWVWFSIMNPHRLAYGFAYSFSFAMIVALLTMSSVLFNSKRNYPFPLNGVTLSLIAFILWINVSPLFPTYSDGEYDPWLRTVKILIMVLVTFYVVGKREELHLLAWVLAVSIGFFGVKGGVFTVAHGGSFKVWGPEGSFIEDNNAMALAIIMVVPLFRYLQLHSANKWIRRGCAAAMLLCVASSVGSYSRGALIALAAMALFLWGKSPNKAVVGFFAVIVGIVIFAAMPDTWSDRMNSINNYEEDGSAMGRINAWWMAWNVAVSRIPLGGGFGIYNAEVFARFAPNPTDIHAAHSIYFQVLGEHGFIGLFIFLAIFIGAWRCGSRVIGLTRNVAELRWAHDLAAMLQVSLIGYGVGGAFLSLTYYDFPYYVASMLVITQIVVTRELKSATRAGAVLKAGTRMSDAAAGRLGFNR